MSEEWMASDFDKAFAWRTGVPRKIEDSQKDPGYEAAKWAWDRQQNIIDELRKQQNDVRLALYRIGVGA